MSRFFLLFALIPACTQDATLVARPPLFAGDDADARALALASAAPTLAELAELHGLSGPEDLVARRVWVDALGTAHVHVRQHLEGIPVFGAEAIVHLDPWGSATDVTDDLLDDVRAETTPALSDEEAIARAAGPDAFSADATLVVLRHGGADRLAWQVQAYQPYSQPVVFVDASSGAELWRYENLQTGTGTSQWYGNIRFGTTAAGGTWYLEDATRHVGTYTFAHGTDDLYYLADADDRWPSALREAYDAQYAASATLDFYRAFGRDGIDGAGGPTWLDAASGSGGVLAIAVQYDDGYLNAFWTGSHVELGSGDGTTCGPLTTLDIVGHELTHGVTQYTAGLIYAGESGALNESFSDCMGAMIERSALGESADTWTIGEATWTPGVAGDALRYLDDPARDGTARDHYASRLRSLDDNGGVHDNSGIGNLAFYLASEGGAHPRRGGAAVHGVGAEAAGAIWYRALTTYMTASTDFAGARTATSRAAEDLYGADSDEVAAVRDAWSAVGVEEDAGDDDAEPWSGGASEDCPDGFVGYAGTLDEGGTAWVPDEDGYVTTEEGLHAAILEGPAGADFDLSLYRYSASSGRWYAAEEAEGTGSSETLVHTGEAGTWRVRVKSVSGSGDWTVCVSHP